MINVIERATFLELEPAEVLAPISRARAFTDSFVLATLEGSEEPAFSGCAPDVKSETTTCPSSSDSETSDGDTTTRRSSSLQDSDSAEPDVVELTEDAPMGMFSFVPVWPMMTAKDMAARMHACSTETRTTLLFRNLPSSFEQQDLLLFLDSCGFKGLYDFIYLPMDFATGSNVGYAFVNFVRPEQAVLAKTQLEGFCAWTDTSCRKLLSVCWSAPYQGLNKLVEHFRNSRVMHGSVKKDHKPMLLVDGVPVPFPRPTKRLRAPC